MKNENRDSVSTGAFLNWNQTMHFLRSKIGEKKFSLILKYRLSEKDAIKLLGIDAVDILQAMKTYTDFTDSTYRTWTITHH